MLRRSFALAAICTIALFSGQAAFADLIFDPPIISTDSMTVAAGGSGTVNVYLKNPSSGGESFDLAGFNVTLSVDGAAGVTFTALSEGTNYVFSGNTFGIAPGGSLPMNDSANWSDLTASGTKTIPADDTLWSLGQWTFTVSNGATAGVFNWSIGLSPATMLVDGSSNEIAFSRAAGTLTVTGGGIVVPEPASMVLFGIGCLAAWSRRRR